jgi:hypothetical protein
MEGAVSSGLFEAVDGGVHCLAGGGEGASGQHFDSLCLSNFGTGLNDLLSDFLELLSEMSELPHLTFNEGISHLLYRSIDDGLIRVSGLEHSLTKGVEGRLRTVARSCTKLDCEHRVTFPHGEVSVWAGVVEYEPYVLGLALVVVGIVNGCGDAKPPV